MGFQLDLTTDSVQDAGPHEPLVVAPETSIRETFELLKKQASWRRVGLPRGPACWRFHGTGCASG